MALAVYLVVGLVYALWSMRWDRCVFVRFLPPDRAPRLGALVGRCTMLAVVAALWPLYALAAAAPAAGAEPTARDPGASERVSRRASRRAESRSAPRAR